MIELYEELCINRFRGGLAIDTTTGNVEGFLALHKYLKENYPCLHEYAPPELIDEYGLLFSIKGERPGDGICFLAHMDTVPAQEEEWTHPPYGGEIDNGFIYGRGAFDMKGQLFAILEAVEHLLNAGQKPRSDIYLFFGFDEESANNVCAATAVALLKSRNVSLKYVLDEGGSVDGHEVHIGIGEKGYLDIELVCRGEGGHSSNPPKATALTDVCTAVTHLKKLKFKKIKLMEREYNTTFAPTMAKGSDAMNVLPTSASIGINFRLVYGQSIQETVSAVQKIMPNGVEVNVLMGNEPTPLSKTDSPGYRRIFQAMEELFPGKTVLPIMIRYGTDSRHFHTLCENVYRITPFVTYEEDSKTIHKSDERLSVESFMGAVRFYLDLIENDNYWRK